MAVSGSTCPKPRWPHGTREFGSGKHHDVRCRNDAGCPDAAILFGSDCPEAATPRLILPSQFSGEIDFVRNRFVPPLHKLRNKLSYTTFLESS